MKNFKFIILAILFALTLPCMYGGCVVVYSSGGFDQDENRTEDGTTVEFVGLTSQAAITAVNAEPLAAGALAGGLSQAAPQSLKLSRIAASGRPDFFRPLRVPLALIDGLRRIELDAELDIAGHSDVITESNNLAGSCGGILSYTLTFDRMSEEFSGELVFDDYCQGADTVSGEADAEGTFEAGSGLFNTAVLSFDDLADKTHTLNGEISMDFTDTPVVATFSVYSTDKKSGQVYWLKDYSINLSEFWNRVEFEVFGTFYHPDNGFVRLETSEPFVVFGADDWPAAGQLTIQGSAATRARLTAVDPSSYRLEADTTGDGSFDWVSAILNWKTDQG
jgi:hypothetical protein